MTNVAFTSIEQYKDIETLNMHRMHVEAGLSSEEFIAGANVNSRDNARTPMQWSAAPHGGFTTGVPWIETNTNYNRINVESSIGDDRSIWNHYRKLVDLRKSLPVMVHGAFQSFLDQHPKVFVYTRSLDDQRIIVVASFAAERITVNVPGELQARGECLVCNYGDRRELGENIEMQPYEAFAILTRNGSVTESEPMPSARATDG